MPIVELDIGGTPRKFQVSEGYTPEDLDHIVQSVNAPIGPAATTDTPTSGAGFRAGQYLTHKGSEFIGAAQGVGKDVQNLVTGQPYGSGFPGERSGWDTAGDVATTAGPIVAPELTAAGLGVGTAARAAGADEPTADIANAVTQLGVGGAQAGRGIYQAVTAPRRAAAVARGVYRTGEGIAQAGERAAGAAQGLENVGTGIGQAAETAGTVVPNLGAGISQAAETAGTTTRNLGAGISQAARAQGATEALGGLRTATPEAAGAVLKSALPPAEKASREAISAGSYGVVRQYADANGLAVTPGTPAAARLAAALQTSDDEWGMLQNSAEHKAVRGLLARLRPTAVDTGVLGPSGQALSRAEQAAPISYGELDDTLKSLQRVRGPSSARAAIASTIDGLFKGTPAEEGLAAAGQTWKTTVRPAKALVSRINNAGTPVEAFTRTVGSVTDATRGQIVQRLLGPASQDWATVTGGFYSRLFERAGGDPVKAAALWAKLRPGVQTLYDPSGAAAKAFGTLREGAQATGEALPAAAAGRGLPAVSALEGLPRLGPAAAAEAAAPATAGQNAAAFARLGVRVGGATEASRRFLHGDWQGGLISLGVAAAANPAAAARAVRGGIGPAARTGIALAGVGAGASLGGGGGGDETQPADIGTAAPAASETPPPSPATPSARIQPLAGPYGREIAAVAHLAGVPGTLIQSHMKVESGGNADAIGDQGRSIGLMQIQPGTATVVAPQAAKLLGRTPDLKNPFDNLLIGGLLLRRYLDQTNGDVSATAQKYNGGENTSGNPMTRQYAGKIIENFRGGG